MTDKGNIYVGVCVDATCGSCRELMMQLHKDSYEIEVLMNYVLAIFVNFLTYMKYSIMVKFR